MKSIDAVEPADCYLNAVQLAAAVEQLRRDLGRTTETRPAIKVTGASPRECWFAALAVHHKAARLAEEFGADVSQPVDHAPPVDKIRPGHVNQVIEAAARHVAAVHKSVCDEAAPAAPAREASRTPSDVFGVLATLSRQLDRLLEKPTTPGEVYERVTLALCYAERLCGDHSHAMPAHEHGKIPADCLARLHEALDAARSLIKSKGHPVIEHGTLGGDTAQVRPSDCYDIATLVLGEVAFLHALAHDSNPPAPYEHVGAGHKLPSHVYALAGALTATIGRISR
ncbi:MAG TPA: hypothetical protein VL463_12175 [Kofleriaceae bacterium]|nr:hypothetical protein [Kofleriaceae bacterium]